MVLYFNSVNPYLGFNQVDHKPGANPLAVTYSCEQAKVPRTASAAHLVQTGF